MKGYGTLDVYVRFEVFTAVTMKNGVFLDLRRVTLVITDVSEEISASFILVTRIGELRTTLAVTSSVLRLLVTANVVPSSPILVTMMKEALISSETSVLTRVTRRNIPEDVILRWMYRSTYSLPRLWLQKSDQPDAPLALLLRTPPPENIIVRK
jgi:hypothetical protein